MNNAHQSNYAAERFAAHNGSEYLVEEMPVEQIEILPMIDVQAKTYDDQFGYGAYDDADDDKYELSIDSCHRAFDNTFSDDE